jgi:hypothetical protein
LISLISTIPKRYLFYLLLVAFVKALIGDENVAWMGEALKYAREEKLRRSSRE